MPLLCSCSGEMSDLIAQGKCPLGRVARILESMRTITLNPKQQRQVQILTRLTSGSLDTAQAAELLGRSVRQTRRLRAKFAAEGMAAVAHGLQGRGARQPHRP